MLRKRVTLINFYDFMGHVTDATMKIKDSHNGTYDLTFTCHKSGSYVIKISLFDRPLKDIDLEMTDHNPPLLSFGSHGAKDDGFIQPCNVTIHPKTSEIFVIDTGNSRIKILDENLSFLGHLENPCLDGRSVTGLTFDRNNNLYVVNWRTKLITLINPRSDDIHRGSTLRSFTYDGFLEPTDVSFDEGESLILVADNGLGKILLFNSKGQYLRCIIPQNKTGKFKDLTSVITYSDSVIVASDCRIQVYNLKTGKYERDIGAMENKVSKGRYGGISVDKRGFLTATRTEKAKSFIQVFNYENGSLYSNIDSFGNKLKRPTGISVLNDGKHLVVVDIGQESVKKYRYL